MVEYYGQGDIPAKEVVTTKRKCIKPKELPLPDPFPLPQIFRPDVECALRAGKMTT